MACWVGIQGQETSTIRRKHAPIMMSPKENLKPKAKKFFSV